MSDRCFPTDGGCENKQVSINNSIVSVQWMYKWELYHRLTTLEINCQCKTNHPLLIELNSPKTAIQVWSVIKQLSASRQELIGWLDRCWQLK